MRRNARAAHLVEHVPTLACERPVNGFLNDDGNPSGMGIAKAIDPAAVINAKAAAEGWPFRCDPDLAFARPDLNLLRDVWHSQATTTAMSDRVLFENKALKSVFRRITIVERITDGSRTRYRVNYQGSYLAALMGNNLGKFVDEHIPPQLLPRWHTVFDGVLDGGAPVRLTIDFEFARLNFASAEAFIAPLSNGAGKVNLVLVGMFVRPRETDTDEPEAA
jgi:hypothetical protein